MSIDPAVLERLPEVSREKMFAFDAAATAAHGAVRSASDRVRSAAAAADAARKDYERDARSRTPFANSRLQHPEPEERRKAQEILGALERKRRAAEAAEQSLDRARAAARQAEEAWQESGAWVPRLSNFVLDLRAGTVLTPVNVTAPKLRKGELPVDGVARTRGEITDLQEGIERIKMAPVTVAEARQRAEEYVASMAACAVADVDGFFQPRQGPIQFSTRRFEVKPFGGGRSMHGVLPDPIALAICANPEAFLDRLLAEIDSVNDDSDEQIPLADRPAMIADLEAKLEAAERAEEAIITEAEAGGTTIPRRSDARPEVVLGVEVVEAAEAAA